MNTYQEKQLKRYGYERDDNEYYYDYRKVLRLDRINVIAMITITYKDDPDLTVYQGVVSVKDKFFVETLGDWDTGKRFKLMDVIADCERIVGFAQTLHNHLSEPEEIKWQEAKKVLNYIVEDDSNESSN